jgi:hypothetical protein
MMILLPNEESRRFPTEVFNQHAVDTGTNVHI